MLKQINKNENRKARHARVRKKVSGTPEKPRLNLYRSNRCNFSFSFNFR